MLVPSLITYALSGDRSMVPSLPQIARPMVASLNIHEGIPQVLSFFVRPPSPPNITRMKTSFLVLPRGKKSTPSSKLLDL